MYLGSFFSFFFSIFYLGIGVQSMTDLPPPRVEGLGRVRKCFSNWWCSHGPFANFRKIKIQLFVFFNSNSINSHVAYCLL